MRSVSIIVLFAFSGQSDAESVDNMVDILVDRALMASPMTSLQHSAHGKQAKSLSTPFGSFAPMQIAHPRSPTMPAVGPPQVRVYASAKLGELYTKISEYREVQIIPSVLPADWAAMGQCVKDLEAAGVDRIQFDVMDGNFVPNLTFGPEMIAACRKYCKTPFETQLMVTNYNSDTMLEEYVKSTMGPNGEPGVVIVHVEACVHLHRTLARIRQLGGSPSVALNPHTPVEMVQNVLDMVDHVLVMTVNPGFGGQAYIPTMLNKIQELRRLIVEGGYDVDIEVDGGVKADWTISQCAAAGANCFIAGSGMFAYPTLKEGCDALRKVALDAQAGNVLPKP